MTGPIKEHAPPGLQTGDSNAQAAELRRRDDEDAKRKWDSAGCCKKCGQKLRFSQKYAKQKHVCTWIELYFVKEDGSVQAIWPRALLFWLLGGIFIAGCIEGLAIHVLWGIIK